MADVLGDPARRSGDVWQWLCPFHADGKSPSLTGYRDGFKCYGCGESGDVISFVQRFHNLGFKDALAALGDKGPNPRVQWSGRLRSQALAHTAKPKNPPCPEWQARAQDVADHCLERLWTPGGERALNWLRGRGLRDETILHWLLGFNDRDREISGLWIPRGITIPQFQGHPKALWGVKVRRASGKPKYAHVTGSVPMLYGVDNLSQQTVAVVCEGEFDALLLWQEAGDLAGIVTFGASTNHDVTTWLPWLLPVKRLLIATDADEPGERAWDFWRKTTARARRLLPPLGAKDITDAWKAGADLRHWIEAELNQ